MKKIINIVLVLLSAASLFGDPTTNAPDARAALESWVGRPLTPAELRFERFLVPVRERVAGTVFNSLECRAFITVPAQLLSIQLTPEMRTAIAQIAPDWKSENAGITLREFSLYVADLPGELVQFRLSCNYTPDTGRTRYRCTTAEEVEMWMYFIQQFGFTDDDLFVL